MLRHRSRYVFYVLSIVIFGFFMIDRKQINQTNYSTTNIDLSQQIWDAVANAEIVRMNYSAKQSETNTVSVEPQVCNIPLLDPFHPDIMKFRKSNHKKPICTYQTFSDVTDEGLLIIKAPFKPKVKKARYAYIIQISPSKSRLDKMITFFDKNKQEDVMMKKDFVKVLIQLENGLQHEEFHVYPVRDFSKHPMRNVTEKHRSLEDLNIVLLCIDSLSRSAVIRSMPKFYQSVHDDPDSVIMKGHTIVGDGTTSQFIGILIGDLEANLPEARINFPKSGYVSRWPFIFADYAKKGYASLYSEDSYSTETFSLRLNGFARNPTDHYLRVFWKAANKFSNKMYLNSPRCIHQLELRLLKRFMRNYRDTPTFSLFALSSGHDSYTNFKLFDKDLYDFNKFLGDTGFRDNTISVVFGDHGARSSAYRATMVGKLEERLPFMAFTFPRWLKQKYPMEFHNFQKNSNIMTAHFDVFATLKNLLNFESGFVNNHKWGKSLFSDIAPLNRTCIEAGVKEHWCPCVQYESVNTKSDVALKLSSYLVNMMSDKLKENSLANEMCERMKISNILRVQKVLTNAKVRQFSGSFRKGCDGCGVKLLRNKQFTSDTYEVVLETKHGSAVFEASLIVDRSSKKITISGEVSRINLYGNQPRCISNDAPHLRKYCYCKNQISP